MHQVSMQSKFDFHCHSRKVIKEVPNLTRLPFLLILQDSMIKCDRKRCVRSACNKSAARNRLVPGQPHDATSGNNDDCCSAQCRARRHQKQKQRMHRDKNDRQPKSSANSKS